jgi:hypothetical protein
MSTHTIATADLPELLALIDDSDSVELKATVPDSDRQSMMHALEMDPIDAEIRQVFFFDTPGLDLYHHGVVVRARRSQRKGGDTVVKLRPVVPHELPKALRRSAGFKVEVDALPGAFMCSGSLAARADTTEVKDVAAGARPLKKLLTREQRELYKAHAPGGIGLGELSVLGPIMVLKLKAPPVAFTRRLVAELWFYPDDTRILELSTKCPPDDTFRAAAETRSYLAQRGIDIDGEQETKTRRALDFFAARLQSAARDG